MQHFHCLEFWLLVNWLNWKMWIPNDLTGRFNLSRTFNFNSNFDLNRRFHLGQWVTTCYITLQHVITRYNIWQLTQLTTYDSLDKCLLLVVNGSCFCWISRRSKLIIFSHWWHCFNVTNHVPKINYGDLLGIPPKMFAIENGPFSSLIYLLKNADVRCVNERVNHH